MAPQPNAAAEPEMPQIPKTQFVMMGLLMGWKMLDLDVSEESGNIIYLRVCFALSMLFVVGCYAVLYSRVVVLPLDKFVTVTVKQPMQPAVTEEVSVQEHDWRELKKLATQAIVGMLVTPCIHLKWGYTLPLVIQSVNVPLTLLSHSLSQVHLFGKAPVDGLARPWKPPPGPFDGFAKLAEAASEAPEGDATAASKDSKVRKNKKKKS